MTASHICHDHGPSGRESGIPPATVESVAIPGMLMIGAASRNAGKTLLATRLIADHSRHRPIAGAKAATVHGNHETCPRGKEGCGVCASLQGPYRISEEQGELPGKDTTRMLEAGADPVLWIVVREGHLADVAQVLGGRLGGDTLTVCESNSLRQVIEPGLFVVVQRAGEERVKRSCRAVWDRADLVVRFDGEGYDVDPGAFRIVDGRWTVRRPATAIVLAGGHSRRMGRDKALLEVEGVPMIQHVVDQLQPHFEEILISANDPSRYAFLGREVVPDSRPGLGPMMAVASALARSRHETNFVVPCDLPQVPPSLLARVLRHARTGADMVVPRTADGHWEPLFAVYRRELRTRMEQKLDQGVRKLIALCDECDTREVPVRDHEQLWNVNTLADYEALVESR